jgi:hypothetical protein
MAKSNRRRMSPDRNEIRKLEPGGEKQLKLCGPPLFTKAIMYLNYLREKWRE